MGTEDVKLMEVALKLQECPQIYNLASSGLLMSFFEPQISKPYQFP